MVAGPFPPPATNSPQPAVWPPLQLGTVEERRVGVWAAALTKGSPTSLQGRGQNTWGRTVVTALFEPAATQTYTYTHT